MSRTEAFLKRTVKCFDYSPSKNKKDDEYPKPPPPNQSSSSIIDNLNSKGSSTRPTVSNEAHQDAVENVVTPAEYITPATSLISSTSTIDNLNSPSKFSNNQFVLLPQSTYTKRMQQLLTTKQPDAHKLTHRLILKEPSSQNPPPCADNNFTEPQITEVQQRFKLWNA